MNAVTVKAKNVVVIMMAKTDDTCNEQRGQQ